MAERTLAATFEDSQQAADAVQVLYRAGFDPAKISLLESNSAEFHTCLSGSGSRRCKTGIGYFMLVLLGMLLGGMASTILFLTLLSGHNWIQLTAGSQLSVVSSCAGGGAAVAVFAGIILHLARRKQIGRPGRKHAGRGNALVLMQCKNIIERYHAETILEEFDALEISSKVCPLGADHLSATR